MVEPVKPEQEPKQDNAVSQDTDLKTEQDAPKQVDLAQVTSQDTGLDRGLKEHTRFDIAKAINQAAQSLQQTLDKVDDISIEPEELFKEIVYFKWIVKTILRSGFHPKLFKQCLTLHKEYKNWVDQLTQVNGKNVHLTNSLFVLMYVKGAMISMQRASLLPDQVNEMLKMLE